MSQELDFKEIVENNSIEDCVTAFNWICDNLDYFEDKVYDYDEILERFIWQLETELSVDTLENIIIDFKNIDTPLGLLQHSYFEFDGYGNVSEIEEKTIRSNLIDFLTDYYDDITDTDVFDVLGIDYE